MVKDRVEMRAGTMMDAHKLLHFVGPLVKQFQKNYR
jgi:hypothetical protein